MSTQKFKPIVWATQFQEDLDLACVFKENTNSEYEGLAKEPGDSVKILGIGKPTVRTWSDGKLHALDTAEDVEDISMTMPVNQVADFNFKVGDLDKAQSAGEGSILSAYMSEAKDVVSEKMDGFIAAFAKDKNVKVAETASSALTKDTILDFMDKGLLALLKNNVSRNTEITLTAPPWFIMMVKQAYVHLDTNNSEMMKNGRVGKYGGMILKESNNVYNDGTHDYIQVKTNRAISFVNPHVHMEPYRPEGYFADAVKGYAIYDGKVTRPKEIVTLKAK